MGRQLKVLPKQDKLNWNLKHKLVLPSWKLIWMLQDNICLSLDERCTVIHLLKALLLCQKWVVLSRNLRNLLLAVLVVLVLLPPLHDAELHNLQEVVHVLHLAVELVVLPEIVVALLAQEEVHPQEDHQEVEEVPQDHLLAKQQIFCSLVCIPSYFSSILF